MKNAKLFRWFSTLALLMLALSWGDAALVAQQEREASTSVTQQQQQPGTTIPQQTNAMGQLPDVATFGGRIMKSGDKLVLQDGIGESTYELDDQTTVKAFEGKNVKVTGTVDPVNNTIRVAEIKPE
jgi:sortase (surface protein transpeptidase)